MFTNLCVVGVLADFISRGVHIDTLNKQSRYAILGAYLILRGPRNCEVSLKPLELTFRVMITEYWR